MFPPRAGASRHFVSRVALNTSNFINKTLLDFCTIVDNDEMRKRKYTALKPSILCSPDSEMPTPVIHNIVATAQIEGSVMPLDLTHISVLLPGSSYDKKRFAAMTLRLANPSCTVLLFSSGKMVITGGRNLYDCMLSALTVCNLLRKILSGVNFRLKACDIQNIVGHCEIPLGDGILDLNVMYEKLNLFSTYQKNMFPGLIYRPRQSHSIAVL